MVERALSKLSADPSGSRTWKTVGAVWSLGWPAIIHLSLLTTVFVADRALVAKLDAGAKLAAMHAATTLSWTVANVLGAVAVGALATVGAHAGAKRHAAALRAAGAALVLVTGLAVVAAAVLWMARRPLLSAWFPSLGPSAHADAATYLAILLPALPAGLFATTASASLHAMRDTRTPLMAAVVGIATNLVVSTHLVLGLWGLPRLGVAGAAIGTAFAFVIQALWLGRRLSKMPHPLVTRSRRGWARLWRVTQPVFGERIAYHGGYLIYAGMVGALGPVAMAAHQGILGLEAFSFTIAEGLGIAAGALAANHLGAGRVDEAERSVAVATVMAVAWLSLCGLLFLSLGPPLFSWLGATEITTELERCLPIAAISQPFVAVAVVGCAALRGAGRTRTALAITLVGAVVVRLLAASLLVDRGLSGAWWAAAADWMCQAVLVATLFVFVKGRARVPAAEQDSRGNRACAELR